MKILIKILKKIIRKIFYKTEKYISELLDKIDAKADFPQSSPMLYYDNIFTGYYYNIYKSYIAFYRLDKNSILVDRILLKKCDYIKKLQLSSADDDN